MAQRKRSNNNKNQNKNSDNNKNHNKNKNNNHKADPRLRMLVDASKTEETRVAVVQNGRLEDFEVESLVRKQIKGNIYLAKVTRVEPSLQAAFVNYGGNRHGFLPFSEIHPDYYRIPVADRERLMEEQAEMERKAAEEAARIAEEEDRKAAEENEKSNSDDDSDDNIVEIQDEEKIIEAGVDSDNNSDDDDDSDDSDDTDDESDGEAMDSDDENDDADDNRDQQKDNRRRGRYGRRRGRGRKYSAARNNPDKISDEDVDDELSVEPFWKRIRRAYKIQEVIKRGQIVLIQVGKEERGNKGAAVTTYITLPGRYCVLMPNTPQSGGVSRKISNFKDRKRMREILKDLNVPAGMSVILRTAGTSRTKAEIKRDLDYLMRLWNNARDLTLKSTAPALINEEGNLIKRAIRDIYNKDIDEVIVSGDGGYKTARDMMKMLMPSHVKKVKHYTDETPLLIAEKMERQIEEMHSPKVELKSGGYLIINPTEALVSIDVNSGRSTKERNIDDTALRTNLEASEEIARQLKLRDLGGLVVIDFIDMENRRYNSKVERAMREALAHDRARIQIGRISSFGLMEMSRQRLHPSLTETHFEPCPHCHGMGIVKTIDTMALTILRAIEESAIEQSGAIVTVTMANEVALYLFNQHRHGITDLETRYDLNVVIATGHVDDERGFTIESKRKPKDETDETDTNVAEELPDTIIDTSDDQSESETDTNESEDQSPKKGRNRNRNRKRNQNKSDDKQESVSDKTAKDEASDETVADSTAENPSEDEAKPKKTTKGRRKSAAAKKIDIKEAPSEDAKPAKTEDTPKESEDKAPTNDNAGQDAASPQPVESAETVNEKPKQKKKGWWNKLSS